MKFWGVKIGLLQIKNQKLKDINEKLIKEIGGA